MTRPVISPVTSILMAYLLLMLSATSAGAQAADEGAAKFVQDMGDQVISIVAAEDMTADSRKEALDAVLRNGVGIERISEYVVAGQWEKASADERARFQDVFSDYLVAAYLRLVTDAGPKSFAVTSAREQGAGRSSVATYIENTSGEPLSLSWIVSDESGNYEITDVMVEGVSQAKTYRDEFAGVAANRGVDGLTDALERKVKKSN
ncbi:MlaC/ttg2D family ABC transporter substrate-binding protein [Denitrobaculum tricleocarpae]|uniref:ABC transporter substrate-binding protein n=1 Tax=Denitrobaculum tricleocarpae TaxID=2591009 RepID=A0A545TU35_9PROT|nr:ABC transporter substrate-binding protein [Denitrobaculum tricleocarpae]TQV80726.1 ABC transporter substrate-binding protein [Denitrobaculum tricleocarpae]